MPSAPHRPQRRRGAPLERRGRLPWKTTSPFAQTTLYKPTRSCRALVPSWEFSNRISGNQQQLLMRRERGFPREGKGGATVGVPSYANWRSCELVPRFANSVHEPGTTLGIGPLVLRISRCPYFWDRSCHMTQKGSRIYPLAVRMTGVPGVEAQCAPPYGEGVFAPAMFQPADTSLVSQRECACAKFTTHNKITS
jgi:hypothetical protein